MSLSELPRGYDAYVTRGPDEPSPEREPEDDDGLTGPMCKECKGTGIVYSDPDHKQLICGDCDGKGRVL
jgi:hypothetical protein